MNNTLIDNSIEALSMTTILRKCISTDGIKTISIATGYWDIPSLPILQEELRHFLEKEGTVLRLLIGKDPYIYVNQLKSPKYKDASYPQDFIRTDIHELDVVEEYKAAIRLLLDYCSDDENSKIQIRVYRKNENDETQFLHSKCYIFDGRQKGIGIGIVGSTNFTQKGLQGNAELNYIETAPNQVLSLDAIPGNKSHLLWFNEKWEISEPWNKQFLEQILKTAPITKEVEKELSKRRKEELARIKEEAMKQAKNELQKMPPPTKPTYKSNEKPKGTSNQKQPGEKDKRRD